jgi:hypothetical protein
VARTAAYRFEVYGRISATELAAVHAALLAAVDVLTRRATEATARIAELPTQPTLTTEPEEQPEPEPTEPMPTNRPAPKATEKKTAPSPRRSRKAASATEA